MIKELNIMFLIDRIFETQNFGLKKRYNNLMLELLKYFGKNLKNLYQLIQNVKSEN